MQLVEENLTVRCYGSTRLTVAVNGSHTAWLLPSSSRKDQAATECELRACHMSRWLEARRPGDLSQRAHISDLYTGTWKQWAYSITPPPGQGRNRRSSNEVYYLVPATGQILDMHGDETEDQQQHQQWSVSSIDYWQGYEMMELTVAEVMTLAQSGTRSRDADADAGAAQAVPGNAVCHRDQTSKPLAGQMQLTVGTSTKRQQPEQQQQGSIKRARTVMHHSSQAGRVQQAELQQLLQLVVGGDHTMHGMLLYLLQQRDEMAFVQFMGHAISERASSRRRAAMLVAALAKDKGILMHSFLMAAASTSATTAAAALEVLATLSEVADADQFLSAVLACRNGVQLLSIALLDADSSPIVPYSSKDFCHRHYSEGGTASQPIRILIGGAAVQTVDGILEQCTRLLSGGSQPQDPQQSIQQQGATALLVLLLASMRNIPTRRATMQAALLLIVQHLCTAAAASGPYQCQFLAGLVWILGLGTLLAWEMWRQVPAAVPQLIAILGQQRPAADLAAQLLHKVAVRAPGVLVKQIPQLVSIQTSARSPLHVVHLLCTVASGSTVGSNTLLPYIDVILTVMAATQQQQHRLREQWPVSWLTSAMSWFSTLATNESTRSELVATPQRMQHLVALLVKQIPWCRYSRLDVVAMAESSKVMSLLISTATGTRLLATNQGLKSLAHMVSCSVSGSDTSFAVDMMTAICVVAAAAAQGSKSELVATNSSSALTAKDIDDCTKAWWWCYDLMECFRRRCWSYGSKLSSSLVVRMFGCLSSLAQLPAGAYHTAKQIQEFQTIISDMQSSNHLSKDEVQLCLQHLTRMKACVAKLQARLAATVGQLSADIQHALVTCAQVHQLIRRDCTKQQLQLLLSMQLQRVTAATAAMSKVEQLVYASQLDNSPSMVGHAADSATLAS